MSSSSLEIGLLLHTRHLICEGEASSHVAEVWEMRLMQRNRIQWNWEVDHEERIRTEGP
jgi:hypothetical protein